MTSRTLACTLPLRVRRSPLAARMATHVLRLRSRRSRLDLQPPRGSCSRPVDGATLPRTPAVWSPAYPASASWSTA
eukprot:1857399-Pleurochrysis_carterae.AAC.1